jgi:hypothetical protein
MSETLLVLASLSCRQSISVSLVREVMKCSLDIVRMQEIRVPDGEGAEKVTVF